MIGFDISKPSLFYVNQWCPSNGPQREIIDETRLDKTITEQDTLYLMDIFNNGKKNNNNPINLLKLKPGKSYDYYISLNYGSYAEVKKSNASYLIIVMDGHMLFTDGKELQVIERDSKDDVNAEVPVIARPLSCSLIPPLAKVLE